MRVLLDECLPRKLGKLLVGHDVSTVQRLGWSSDTNGTLLQRASAGFDVLLTIDASIPFQQNLGDCSIGLIVLSAPHEPTGGSCTAGAAGPPSDRPH